MGKQLKPDSEQDKVQGKARADRIRYLRNLLDVSREKFAKKHGISLGTLQSWEDVRYGGLTDKGAAQLLEAFQAEGIVNCTIEWLMYGKGEKPTKKSFLDEFLGQSALKSDDAILANELQLFSQLHKNPVDLAITDDGLVPFYLPGEHVAGERFFGQEIVKAVGYTCIVQTQAGVLLVRKVELGTQEGTYNLVCTNPETTVAEPALSNTKLLSAAPIIWIRRPRVI
jgi:DNA-binding transcriptional regulator YiaG